MNTHDQIGLGPAALDALMPMHALLTSGGEVLHLGPTLARLLPENALGTGLFDLVEPLRPQKASQIRDLCAANAGAIHVRIRSKPKTRLRGLAVPLAGQDGYLLNLSFGIGVASAVRDLSLTQSDFASTDLAVELLYLIEARSAVMKESRKLNLRLEDARMSAEEKAFTDGLTGLRNRRALDHVLARLLAAGARFALIHLDLDYFKQVNDTLGHAAGDQVLQTVAQRLLEQTREADSVARIGGDEFVLIFDRQTDPVQISQLAERIISRLEVPISYAEQDCRISASVGIAISTDYAIPTAETLLADADAALYASKRKGRARATLAVAPCPKVSEGPEP